MRLDQEYKDYYAILGVKKDATPKDIKAAYRRLARKYHPDVNPGDKAAEEKFKDLQEAYDVLGDPAKRQKYDLYGEQWKHISESGARPGARGPFDAGQYGFSTETGGAESFDFSGGGLGDLLSSIFGGRPGDTGFGPFGGRRPQSRPRKGDDVTGEMTVSLRDAYSGVERSVTLTPPDGTPRTLKVKVPRGIADGAKLRLAGQGMPGPPGGQPGDLLLTIHVTEPPGFSRRGDDLYVETKLTYPEAVLGTEKRIKLLDGSVRTLTIPAGVQPGQSIRLRGQGMPRRGKDNSFGDLYVTVRIVVPRNVSGRQKELIEQLRALEQAES